MNERPQGSRERARRLRQRERREQNEKRRVAHFWRVIGEAVVAQSLIDLNEPRPIQRWLEEQR